MKVRHAAALALVGWYLIMPPGDLIGIPMPNWQRRAVRIVRRSAPQEMRLLDAVALSLCDKTY
jgi:hypothetical protein